MKAIVTELLSCPTRKGHLVYKEKIEAKKEAIENAVNEYIFHRVNKLSAIPVELFKVQILNYKGASVTVSPKENSDVNIEIVQYTEKSYAIFGDTKPIKESIKAAGGKWNRFLKKGTETVAGWVIPTKNRSIEEIRSLILK